MVWLLFSSHRNTNENKNPFRVSYYHLQCVSSCVAKPAISMDASTLVWAIPAWRLSCASSYHLRKDQLPTYSCFYQLWKIICCINSINLIEPARLARHNGLIFHSNNNCLPVEMNRIKNKHFYSIMWSMTDVLLRRSWVENPWPFFQFTPWQQKHELQGKRLIVKRVQGKWPGSPLHLNSQLAVGLVRIRHVFRSLHSAVWLFLNHNLQLCTASWQILIYFFTSLCPPPLQPLYA